MRGKVGLQRAGADLRGRDLRGWDLRAANLHGARLDDADLRGADLWAANVANASLRRCDLRGARLVQTSFAGSDLRAAKLAGAELVMTDLGGAHLACVVTERPRRGPWVDFARQYRCPSFVDALRVHHTALRLQASHALLALEAAADVSEDFAGELRRLLHAAPRASVPALACVRFRMVEFRPLVVARVGRCREFETATLGAAAVLLGTPLDELTPCHSYGFTPEIGLRMFRKGVERCIRTVEAWPDREALPPPYYDGG